MFILVQVMPAQMDGKDTIRRWAARSKQEVMREIASDCLAWRLHDGSGWCDGTPNAHKWIVNAEGLGYIIAG